MKLIKDLGQQLPSESSKQKKRFGIYKCPICKDEFRTQSAHVKSGHTKQCMSCARKHGRKHKTHGMKGTRLYSIFSGMNDRCYNEKSSNYHNWGERGVGICTEWLNDRGLFFSWALENGYKEDLTIDRIESDKGYCPSNCRWVNKEAQAQNRRKQEGCSSKYAGVRLAKGKLFEARVMISGVRYHIGNFKTDIEAALARDRFILDGGHKYAKLNILKRTT